MQNEAQYDLDRKAAKISALSSNNLDIYEYLTGEDLGLKPSTVGQAKFEYSPLGKVFNKGLIEETKTIEKDVDSRKLKITGDNNITYDFSDFKTFKELYKDLYDKKMTIDDAKIKQNEFNAKFNALSRYSPRNKKY